MLDVAISMGRKKKEGSGNLIADRVLSVEWKKSD